MRELLCIFVAAITVAAAATGHAQGMSAMEKDVVQLVDDVSKSIVSVAALPGTAPASLRGPFSSGQAPRSVGCGVVFDEGLILTTASVVGYSTQVEIGTREGMKYRGSVVGVDPESDIAVVKVEGTNLRPAKFGGGGEVRPGSLIFILGNAFGSLPSVSMGVVSNVTGPIVDARGDAVLRLSAPINPGDIGGPVVSVKSEVIGIVIGRLTFRSGYRSVRMGEGTAFGFSAGLQHSNMTVALPVARAIQVAWDIVESGGTERGFLGIQVVDLSDNLKLKLNDPDLRGVQVTYVVGGSPAESIGIRAGDIVTALGRRSVETVDVLREAMSTFAPGDLADISFVRGRASRSDVVRVARRLPEFVQEASFVEDKLGSEELRARINDLSLELEILNRQLKELEAEE